MGIFAEGQEIEIVGVFDDILRQVGLWRRKSTVEIGNGLPLPTMEPALDLMNEHVAAPAVLNGRLAYQIALL